MLHKPSKGPLQHSALGRYLEAMNIVDALDHLELEPRGLVSKPPRKSLDRCSHRGPTASRLFKARATGVRELRGLRTAPTYSEAPQQHRQGGDANKRFTAFRLLARIAARFAFMCVRANVFDV
jgi:hypothetical protein